MATNSSSAPPNTAPAPIQDFGNTPYVDPAYINPQQNEAYMQQYEQLYAEMLGPQFAQQDQQLQDSDAARGISSSGAAGYLQGNLMGNQAGALAGGLTPIVQQGYGYEQQDTMANAQYANEATLTNANFYNQDRNANFNAYNNYQNELTGAYLGTLGPNAGVGNLFGESINGQNQGYLSAYEMEMQQQDAELGLAGDALGMYGGGGGGGTYFTPSPGLGAGGTWPTGDY
jgi:hypothetical protein